MPWSNWSFYRPEIVVLNFVNLVSFHYSSLFSFFSIMVTKYNKGMKSITGLVIHVTEKKKKSSKIIMSYSMVTLI